MHENLSSTHASALVMIVLAGAGLTGAASAQTNPLTPVPIPAPVPAKEAVASIPDTRLWYWDTGGTGAPVVFLHPATGSGLIWGYQQPAFANAGYRVIAYSRRGYGGSDPVPKENPGTAAGDLQNLVDSLGLKKFHLVGSAAGGGIAMDYAHSHPERLLSLVIACAIGGVLDKDYVELSARLRQSNRMLS